MAQGLTAQDADSTMEKSKKVRLQYYSLAFTNNHTAYPFASFSKLVTGEWHPGFELGTGFNWSQKNKHDWYQEFSKKMW